MFYKLVQVKIVIKLLKLNMLIGFSHKMVVHNTHNEKENTLRL